MKSLHPILYLLIISSMLFIGACGSQSTSQADTSPKAEEVISSPPLSALDSLQDQHQLAIWQNKQAFRCQIALIFGEKPRLMGQLTFMTDISKVRIDIDGGETMIWTGEEALVSSEEMSLQRARFDVLTWPYFLAAPFKLQDPGTKFTDTLSLPPLARGSHPIGKLSFEAGVGDAPDDWYILYRDSQSGLLDAMAYIVTFRQAQAEAETDPHAIVYESYTQVDGVSIADEWTFWGWKDGKLTEKLGEAQLTDLTFVEVNAPYFTLSADTP